MSRASTVAGGVRKAYPIPRGGRHRRLRRACCWPRKDFSTRRNVNRFLVAWLCVTWGAVLVRADDFPLTWAPMYSSWEPKEVASNRVLETPVYMRGMLVTRSDGTTGYVGARELDIARDHMYRLYYQRTFGQGPVTYEHASRCSTRCPTG